MSFTSDVASLTEALGPFYEYVAEEIKNSDNTDAESSEEKSEVCGQDEKEEEEERESISDSGIDKEEAEEVEEATKEADGDGEVTLALGRYDAETTGIGNSTCRDFKNMLQHL